MSYKIGDIIKYEDPWYKLSWLKKQFKKKIEIKLYRYLLKDPDFIILKNNDKFVVTFITTDDNILLVTPYYDNKEYSKFEFKGDISKSNETELFVQLINSLNGDYIIDDKSLTDFIVVSDIKKDSRNKKLKKIYSK